MNTEVVNCIIYQYHMDLTKAQQLLLKIQTFLDMANGNELSRLEKDLMKSYIIQLYDEVSTDQESVLATPQKSKREMPAPEPVMPKKEFTPPPVVVDTASTPEPVVEVKAPPISPTPPPPVVEIPEPVIEEKPAPAPQKATVPTPVTMKATASEELSKLFELNHPEKMDSRFSHVPIDDIASALGLNEKIFTLNVLFGGDREMFESTCDRLNRLNSFSEATDILLAGPAAKFNWSDRENVKMAEHFIRTVARRYSKS